MVTLTFLLQPVLQELGKQNLSLSRLIQEHHGEFLQLINDPVEGSEGSAYCLPYVLYARQFYYIIVFY